MSKQKEPWRPITPVEPPAGSGVFDLAPKEHEISVTDQRAEKPPVAPAAPIAPASRAVTPAAARKASGRKKKHLIGARFEADMQRQFNDVRAEVMQRYGNNDVRMQEIIAAILEATLKTDEASIDWIVEQMEARKAKELAKSAPIGGQ